MSKYFRTPTGKGLKGPDTFIQLERKRILSTGEKREISYAGIAARRKTPSFAPRKIAPTNFLKSSKVKSGRKTFF
jgi:hypothetical protein